MNATLRSIALAGAATALMLAVLISLGVWQLHRLAWKEGLIAQVSGRVDAPPVEAPPPRDWAGLKPDDYEYRHVRLTGVYDLTHQALVFRALTEPRGRYGGPGYLVLTPLRLASGPSVLVNRGFVPGDLKAAAAQGPQGETTVTGLMRASEGRTWFTPADDPASGRYFTKDVETIAKGLGLGPHAPFEIDADASGGPDALPEGGETILAFPNNHLSYALTWFGLALGLAGVFVAFVWGKLRSREAQAAS